MHNSIRSQTLVCNVNNILADLFLRKHQKSLAAIICRLSSNLMVSKSCKRLSYQFCVCGMAYTKAHYIQLCCIHNCSFFRICRSTTDLSVEHQQRYLQLCMTKHTCESLHTYIHTCQSNVKVTYICRKNSGIKYWNTEIIFVCLNLTNMYTSTIRASLLKSTISNKTKYACMYIWTWPKYNFDARAIQRFLGHTVSDV
jgi:hypothetical protein